MKTSGLGIIKNAVITFAAALILQACGLGTPITKSSPQNACPANTAIFQIEDNTLTALCGCTGKNELGTYGIRSYTLLCTIPQNTVVQFAFTGTAAFHTLSAFNTTFTQTIQPNQTLTQTAKTLGTSIFFDDVLKLSGAITVVAP